MTRGLKRASSIISPAIHGTGPFTSIGVIDFSGLSGARRSQSVVLGMNRTDVLHIKKHKNHTNVPLRCFAKQRLWLRSVLLLGLPSVVWVAHRSG